jgi:SAM-dependent methyltransferase
VWAQLRGRISGRIRRRGQFARDSATRRDRYPLAFQFARRWLGDKDDLRILSFGCSSGEEVLTLCSYFPSAAIKGIDIEPRRIALARTVAIGRADITFEVAGTAAHEPAGIYDAIFCMAVFRDPVLDLPGTSRVVGPLTFEAFEAEVGELVRCLKPGGLLLAAHSNFRVSDTRAAAQLELVLHADPPGSGLTPGLYGPTGSRLENAVDRSLGYAKLAR